MTISSPISRVDYTGNNATSVYNYPFRIFQSSDLLVTKRDLSNVQTTLVLNTDYTVTGAGALGGGTVTLLAGNLPTGFALTIRRVVALTQETDIRNQGDFYPEAIEDEFDKLTMISQDLQDQLNRAVQLPETLNGAQTYALAAAASATSAAASASSAAAAANVFNVSAYGAIGDDSHDDTAAIQAALTAAGNNGGGVVLLPPGTYKTTSQITWPDKSNISLVGAGMGASTIKCHFGGFPATVVRGIYIVSATSLYNVRIQGLTLQGLANDDTAIEQLVYVDNNVFNVSLFQVEMKWARLAGIHFSQSVRTTNSDISHCYFHLINSTAMTGTAGAAILGLLDRSRVSNCLFEAIGNSGQFHAVYPKNNVDVVIADNVFNGLGSHLHLASGSFQNFTITGNVFNLTTVFLLGVSNAVFANNILYEARIKIGSDGVSILNNRFYPDTNTNDYCITADLDCSDVVISGNSFVNESGPSNSNFAIIFDPGTSSASDSWIITDNTFIGFLQSIYIYGTNFIVARNSILTTSTSPAIDFEGGSGHSAIENIIKSDSNSYGIYNVSGAVIVVKGNTLLGGCTVGGNSGGIVTVPQPYVSSGVRSVTANYTMTADDSIVTGDATGGAFTVTLPAIGGGTAGIGKNKQFTIRRSNSGGNAITVAGTINGATNKSLASQYASLTVVDNGTEWQIVSTFGTVS